MAYVPAIAELLSILALVMSVAFCLRNRKAKP